MPRPRPCPHPDTRVPRPPSSGPARLACGRQAASTLASPQAPTDTWLLGLRLFPLRLTRDGNKPWLRVKDTERDSHTGRDQASLGRTRQGRRKDAARPSGGVGRGADSSLQRRRGEQGGPTRGALGQEVTCPVRSPDGTQRMGFPSLSRKHSGNTEREHTHTRGFGRIRGHGAARLGGRAVCSLSGARRAEGRSRTGAGPSEQACRTCGVCTT